MKLFEAAGRAPGHWTYHKNDRGVRHWKPIYTGSPTDPQLFPFAISNKGTQKTGEKTYAGFNIMPSGMNFSKLRKVGQYDEFIGLLNALKHRPNKHGVTADVIDERVFDELMHRCASNAISKSGLRSIVGGGARFWNRLILVTPGSSSTVAVDFANLIQTMIGLPDKQVFHGHFDKRDVDDFYTDVDANPDINRKARSAILKSLNNRPPGTPIQAKHMKQGDREHARKAGIDMLHVSKDINVAPESRIISAKELPVLAIIDDNIQQGTTFKTVSKLFIQHTGIVPKEVISINMFRL